MTARKPKQPKRNPTHQQVRDTAARWLRDVRRTVAAAGNRIEKVHDGSWIVRTPGGRGIAHHAISVVTMRVESTDIEQPTWRCLECGGMHEYQGPGCSGVRIGGAA